MGLRPKPRREAYRPLALPERRADSRVVAGCRAALVGLSPFPWLLDAMLRCPCRVLEAT